MTVMTSSQCMSEGKMTSVYLTDLSVVTHNRSSAGRLEAGFQVPTYGVTAGAASFGGDVAETTLVGYGEFGRRVGETHHRASISDAMVERIRDMREFERHTYPHISRVTGVGLRSVVMICTYKRRIARVVQYRKVVTGG